jgi:putative protease
MTPAHATILSDTERSVPKLPELLCPVGSPFALDAAIEGGADALYLGGSAFNARMNAANFDAEQLKDAIKTAHAYGVKVYLTMNTLLYDREQRDYLNAAMQAAEYGVDALIVADLGGASAIHRALPTLPLHASTQMSAHNADAGIELAKHGYSRMVVARELSREDLSRIVARSPIEIEAFIHGALCVCHSGQCLFSSLVGGRSGNRGECAQPCRLPYRAQGSNKDAYPLSLKDLSLAKHVPALIDMGLASLKIEGRMKSPTYVLTVTRIWRRLLDERRAATADEMRELADAFSRGGFTDGYFTRHIDRSMLGVRSERDKAQSEKLADTPTKITRTIPLDLELSVRTGVPMSATVRAGEHHATAEGLVPQAAKTAPIDRELLMRQFSKLGGTPYRLRNVDIELDDGLMVPVSALNELRRSALCALSEQLHPHYDTARTPELPQKPTQSRADVTGERTARFARPEQLTDRALAYFDRRYLPLHTLLASPALIERANEAGKPLGVLLPEVVRECELPAIQSMVDRVALLGIDHAMVGNLGHISLATAHGMTLEGDFRLNVTNTQTAAQLHAMGFSTLMLSPEMTLPQIRDVGGAVRTVVYGRIPLMVLEKCATHELYSCKTCDAGEATLVDRRGISFPLGRTYDHRTLIYNSAPTYMADKQDLLKKYNVGGYHFMFTTEAPREVDAVIRAYEQGSAATTPIRRIGT